MTYVHGEVRFIAGGRWLEPDPLADQLRTNRRGLQRLVKRLGVRTLRAGMRTLIHAEDWEKALQGPVSNDDVDEASAPRAG